MDARDSRDKPLGLGSLLAAAGGLLLLVSLFVDWYGPDRDAGFGGDEGAGASAWNSFELIDLILAALALAAIYAAPTRLARSGGAPAPPTPLLRAAGPLALVLVLYALLDKPPILRLSGSEFELGIWLGLAGALLMTAGSILDRYRVSLVLGDRRGSAGPRADPPPPPADPGAETQAMPRRPGPPR